MTQELSAPDRLLTLGSVFNARDIGGYRTPRGPIAWRRVLRAACLDGLDDDAHRFLAELGLRTVLDLRRDEERVERPNALGTLDVRTMHISIRPGALRPDPLDIPTLAEIYDDMAETSSPMIGAALTALAEPDALPAIVHCTAGKDRTGLVIACLLAIAGVSDDDIIADYAASGDLLGEAFAATLPPVDDDDTAAAMLALLASPPEMIRSVLERMRTAHGSVEGHLIHHGMDPSVPERLRAALH